MQMKANCEGCVEDFWQMIEYQREGLHFTYHEESYPFDDKNHLFVYMVDDEGEVLVG